jgi:hypothetical protein
MAMDPTANPRARYAGWVPPLCWPPVALGAVSISLVNRDPAPDEPMAVTEADHVGERRR